MSLGGDGFTPSDPVCIDGDIHIIIQELRVVIAGYHGYNVGPLLPDGLECRYDSLHPIIE